MTETAAIAVFSAASLPVVSSIEASRASIFAVKPSGVDPLLRKAFRQSLTTIIRSLFAPSTLCSSGVPTRVELIEQITQPTARYWSRSLWAKTAVEMRFRHFSPELAAWETEFKQSMLLTSHATDRDVFVNQEPFAKALMSTQPRTTTFIRQGDGSYVGRSEILDENGKPSVIEGVYHRVK